MAKKKMTSKAKSKALKGLKGKIGRRSSAGGGSKG